AEAKLVEHIWKICTSFPDPRLWNNRVAALAGTTRSTGVLALSASTAVSEASVYGRRADIRGAEFLKTTLEKVEGGEELEGVIVDYYKRFRGVPGYGRPIVSTDERISPLLREAKKLDLDQGKHLSLVSQIEIVLKKKRYRLNANI